MILDIGAKRPIEGDDVFLIGRCFSSAEPAFVLLYSHKKAKRSKRNVSNVDPAKLVEILGADDFVEIAAPHWGTVWFRKSKTRSVQEIPSTHLAHSSAAFGSIVLFNHDSEPLDQNAGFYLFGLTASDASELFEHGSRPNSSYMDSSVNQDSLV